MNAHAFYFTAMLFSASPFLAIVAILAFSALRRRAWKRQKRKGKKPLGVCSSSSGLSEAFMLVSTFYRPRLQFAIEVSQREEVEEDDQGGPETPEKHLHRQLRRIRRGEPVDHLEVRL